MSNRKKEQIHPVPTDPNMTLDVRNDEVEAQVKLYMKEKTGENLNTLVTLLRESRVLVPANLNGEKQPMPCLLNHPQNGNFLPVYTSKEQIPREPKSEVILNLPFLAANRLAASQIELVNGIAINPFSDNLIFKRKLLDRIEEVEKMRKEGKEPKQVSLTPEQYLMFERKQFEFGYLPKRFFEQGKRMLDALCQEKENYIDHFFEECYQHTRMYPYLTEDFSVMVMNISQELLLVRVDLPGKDMGVPSCYRVYFSWNDVTGQGRYFTIEKTKETGVHLLGEFGKDLTHIDHGEAPAEGAELQRIIDLIKEPAS